ncbi:MAG TPA: translation initiation factor IF-2 [Syntrophorhabdaceae bacterium]|nr:translation initiation factor IF-2 [Syntrophorhabdaceae bacterium]
MQKPKITPIKDKLIEEELLSKLKIKGKKIKGKDSAYAPKEERQEEITTSGEQVIEKRVSSVIIRRRVQHTEPPSLEREKIIPPEDKKEVKETLKVVPEIKPQERETVILQPVTVKKEVKKEIEEKAVQVLKEERPLPHIERPPVKIIEETEAIKVIEEKEPVKHLEEKEQEKKKRVEEAVIEKPIIEKEAEEQLKGDIEAIEKKKGEEITKALEEHYKQELERGIELGKEEEDEGKKKKKVEKLLKKIEEQELEEIKFKKKGLLKRKVVIKEDELYPFKRQKPKAGQLKKDKKEKKEEKREPEEKLQEIKPVKKVVKIRDEIQVGELAKKMGIKAQELIARLLSLGVLSGINQNIDFDTAFLVASEFGFEVEKITSIEEDFLAMEEEQKERPEDLKPRPPVVTIMGHVDHGKTLLLDTIRHTNVAEHEAGGITQHIGAYMVNVDGKDITFIDTPGHEAFTAMRARGARVTDIVVLVVAADDGVMPQTIEAINHARAANVPIIVAINKIDKENANPDRVMKDLANYDLIPEEWGGSTLFAKISAKKKIGIKELLELIILQAEMLELKANPDKLARGIIIESKLDKGHGPVGTVIIQEGTLKIQDPFIAGHMFGRVRAMFDDNGKRITKAPPSTPVLVVGFQEVPQAGDMFIVTTEERYAKELSRYRQERLKEMETLKSARTSLEALYTKMGESEKVFLNVILKGDVRGTIDAIVEALKKLSNEKVEIQIVHSGVGAITETDVNLAMASGAIIIGFNVKSISKAQSLAEQEKIEIRTYSIIYEMIDDIKKAMEGMLAPKIVDVDIGKAEIRKVFTISKTGNIAGCYVTEGKVTRNAFARVIRDGNNIYTGKIISLKRFKDDVKEVQSGYECGIVIENFNDVKEGDTLEFFIQEKEKQTLN